MSWVEGLCVLTRSPVRGRLCQNAMSRGSVTANIESLYIQNYGLTMTVYSNERFFQEPYIQIYGFFWSFCEVFWSFVKIFEAHIRSLSYEFLAFFHFETPRKWHLWNLQKLSIFDILWSWNPLNSIRYPTGLTPFKFEFTTSDTPSIFEFRGAVAGSEYQI